MFIFKILIILLLVRLGSFTKYSILNESLLYCIGSQCELVQNISVPNTMEKCTKSIPVKFVINGKERIGFINENNFIVNKSIFSECFYKAYSFRNNYIIRSEKKIEVLPIKDNQSTNNSSDYLKYINDFINNNEIFINLKTLVFELVLLVGFVKSKSDVISHGLDYLKK